MTTWEPFNFQCPICDCTFSSNAIISTNTFGGVETDFRAYASGMDPLPFYIHQCPKCHFSFMVGEFSVSDVLKDYVLSRKIFIGIEKTALIDCSTKYEIFGRGLAINRSSYENIAWAYLRASWMARSEFDRPKEKRLQLLAIDYFERAIKERTLTKEEDYEHVAFLIGELYRRTKSFNQAIEWFSQVNEPREQDAHRQKVLAEQGNSSPTFFTDEIHMINLAGGWTEPDYFSITEEEREKSREALDKLADLMTTIQSSKERSIQSSEGRSKEKLAGKKNVILKGFLKILIKNMFRVIR
ncbi:MAG: DUF2225 domain-containing protein [Promethearchaeota archaeon]